MIETVRGVPIYRKMPPAPLVLVAGRRGRFDPDGPVYEVSSVGCAAAYVFKVYDPPREVTVTAKDGTERIIRVSRGPIEPGVSLATRFSERVS